MLEMPDGKNDALGLPCCASPILTKAASESRFLLGWLELRQKQGMSDADLFGIERLDHCRDKLGQSGASGDVSGCFADLRPDLLDGVLRLLQIQKRMKALRFLQWVNVPTLQVLDESGFHRLGIREVDDANGNGCGLGDLSGAIASGSSDDLEALPGERPHKQGRQYALDSDGLGKLS